MDNLVPEDVKLFTLAMSQLKMYRAKHFIIIYIYIYIYMLFDS